MNSNLSYMIDQEFWQDVNYLILDFAKGTNRYKRRFFCIFCAKSQKVTTVSFQKKWSRLWSSQAIENWPKIAASRVHRLSLTLIFSRPKNGQILRFFPSKICLARYFDILQKNPVPHFLRRTKLVGSFFVKINP